jgi:hypothetical protein
MTTATGLLLLPAREVYREAVLLDGPVGYWPLGEQTGTAARDVSGNGRTGTYSGTYTLGQAGALGDEPDGTSNPSVRINNGYVQVPYNAALGMTAAFSVELWAYKLADVDFARFGGRGIVTGSADDISILADNTGKFNATARKSTGTVSFPSTPVIPITTWVHLVFTYDGTNLRTYANGAVSGAPVALGAALLNQTGDWYLGHQSGGGTANARIGGYAVYATALSAARIAAHYLAGKGAYR